ncbi:MAG: pyridoxal-phosphate dependent enzyme [Acetobacteraceae bacterium]
MTSRAAIAAAARRLAPVIRHTPALRVSRDEIGLAGTPLAHLTLKLELLQHTGSFKPRGAFNRLLVARERGNFGHADVIAVPGAEGMIAARGGAGAIAGSGGVDIIAASGGNHGAAVAFAARSLGLAAEIFVPATTPTAKRARIESYGARLVPVGADYAAALAASRIRQAETGALDVHAYDDPDVIAGQGTVGREFEQDAPDLTHVLVAAGGGGLLAGIAAWYAGSVQVIGVEPEACPTLHAARAAGRPVAVATGGIAADSLGARQAGAQVFPLIEAHVAALVLVTEDAIAAARRLLWDRARILAEPGGATALAALLCGAFVPPEGARVGVVVCGGNTGTLPD